MKRIHIHVAVDDLNQSIEFYSTLFAAQPTRVEKEYAKWTLDDPAVNFAISVSEDERGVNHLGIESSDRDGLDDIAQRLRTAGAATFDQEATSCCYAVSDKSWVSDPSGVHWETFFTHGKADNYEDVALRQALANMASDKREGATSICCS